MCGIVGILADKDVAPLLVEGLRRLEYRGYDSTGIATLWNGDVQRRRAQGKLSALENKLARSPLPGTLGIGHTRWATHGAPTEDNAHPHATEKMAVVHNGIIENYAELKAELRAGGAVFTTETDTEVIAHLVTFYMNKGLSPRAACDAAFDRLEGAYAVACIFKGEDNLLIGARQGTPLVIGYGEGEMYVASDSYALAPFTQKISFLDDGDRVIVTRQGAEIYDRSGNKVIRPVRVTAQSGATTGKGEYRHYMLKEIHEQPLVIGDTLNSFINAATGRVFLQPEILDALEKAPRLTLVACGTAFYACMVAKYWFERIARLPCEVDIASEYRYREAPLPEGGVCLFVSQSGETLDTLEALRFSKRQGQTILSVVNAVETTIERESDQCLHTLAGPEIGVASTKAFTTQITTLACMALALGVRKKLVDPAREEEMTAALRHIPVLSAQILKECEKPVEEIAREIMTARDMLYLGRGGLYPVALEGALKLKEVSYIHAEGYAAGEMKHGPIALIDENVPVAVLAPARDPLFEKTASNIQVTVARGGKILLLTDPAGAEKLSEFARWTITLPEMDPFTSPILYTLPVQLLAYYVAIAKGTDVDQPRNLAKSVTVE